MVHWNSALSHRRYAVAFRSSPEVAAELRKAMIAAGVSTEVEPEKVISGATRLDSGSYQVNAARF